MAGERIISKDLGPVSAYAIAKAAGYTGTEADWAADVANIGTRSLDAEAFAAGTRAGEPVESTDPAYENNGAYYLEQTTAAKTAAESASTDAETAQTAAESARDAALTAQAAAETAASTEVSAWLDEKFPTRVEALVDNTLTTANAAADAQVTGASIGQVLAQTAPQFAPSTNYTAGQYVTNSGVLYRFTADHPAGNWTGSDAVAVNVGSELADLKGAVENDSIKFASLFPSETPTLTIEQGGISSSNGMPASASSGNYTKRLRTATYIQNPQNGYILFRIPEGFWAAISQYTSDNVSTFIENYSSAIYGTNMIILTANYIKITFGKDGNPAITPSDLPTDTPIVTFVHITDKALTTSNAPADAKVVGDKIDTALKLASYDGGTLVSNQTLNTVCAFQPSAINAEDLPPEITNFSSRHWLITFGGSLRRMQFLISNIRLATTFYVRSWNVGDPVGSWCANASVYDIFPTGDSTDRTETITYILQLRGCCRFAPGEYYISSFDIGNGALIGVSMGETKLIYYDESESTPSPWYAIRAQSKAHISNLTLEYYVENTGTEIVPVADYTLGIHGIAIGNISSGGDTKDTEITIENVMIANFPGCGFFGRRSTEAVEGSVSLVNVRATYCSAGFYFGDHCEYNTVTGCHASRNYTGMIIMGGNNVISGCCIGSNEVNLTFPETDTYGSARNDGHGVVTGCKLTHAGYFSSQDPPKVEANAYDIIAGEQSSVEQIIGCFIGYPIKITGRAQPFVITGCQIRRGCSITVDHAPVRMSSCYFQNETPTMAVLNGGTLIMHDCYDYSGNVINYP